MAAHTHRQGRWTRGGSHPSGMFGGFGIHQGTPEPSTYRGVRMPSSTNPRFPAAKAFADHWLNVKEWSVGIVFNTESVLGGTHFDLDVSVLVPTGSTVILDAAGAIASTTPEEWVDRADLYKSGAATSVSWSESSGESGGPYGDYEHAANFSMSISHGSWAYNNDLGVWVLGMDATATSSVNDGFVPPDDYTNSGGPEASPWTDCEADYHYVEGSQVEVPPGPDTYEWTCAYDISADSGRDTRQLDTNGTVAAGTLMGNSIRYNKTLENYGISHGLVYSLTIAPNTYYDAWF